MNKQNRTTFLILIILGIILLFSLGDCNIEFNVDLKSGDVIAKLISFGILAILIERFVDNVIIPTPYREMINNIRNKSSKNRDGFVEALTDNTTNEHSEKFSWMSFGLSFLIASIGFRFFAEICDSSCDDSIHSNYLFPGIDIFLTAILLSGGSQLIVRIIKWIEDQSK